MGADSTKNLLIQCNQQRYKEFLLNGDPEISLSSISSVPWIVGFSGRKDVYKKNILPKDKANHLCFITKNDEPHHFVWRTNPERLKQAVRWGIIHTESITGKVISALGKYRILAHERVAKGMISNTQVLKLELLDLYQERFEALQALELLVNKNNSKENYELAIANYIARINDISSQLKLRFGQSELMTIHSGAIDQITGDLTQDIQRAESFLTHLKNRPTLRATNRARGQKSVLEFVKKQMAHNLYELQGLNQDLSYSNKRKFALTRGEFNDCIEDARKELDDYRADPRNAITPAHQGSYSIKEDYDHLTYDFSMDHPSPDREREILLAISFIEGWDEVVNEPGKDSYVENDLGTASLRRVLSTNWRSHRNLKAFFTSAAYFVLNMLKSFFVETHPWEEEAWEAEEEEFHLVATTLRAHAKPNKPLWYKPYKFLKAILYGVVDVFRGINDIGVDFIFNLPPALFHDYRSTKELPAVGSVIEQAEQELSLIKKSEDERLVSLLGSYPFDAYSSEPTSTLVQAEYHLTPGEWEDIINSVIRGVNGFSSFFTHGIYAKDPVAGVLFTTAYAIGGAAIFCPAISATLLSAGYVNGFTNFAHAMGTSKFAAVIAGASTQAQLASSAWDFAMHGPKSGIATLATQVLQDPLMMGTYFAAAYGLGYLLVNGVNGHTIPWLSEALKEDMGSTPELSYPIVGGKIAILLYEALQTHQPYPYHQVELRYNGKEQDHSHLRYYEGYKKIIDRFCFTLWLSNNALVLPKLESDTLFNIEQQIDSLFSGEEAHSLKKILYPEKIHSIAHRLFSLPLGYIPALFRLAVSPLISVFAWAQENPNASAPMARASKALSERIRKDLSRLVVATIDVAHLFYNVIGSQIKAFAYTANMIIGRLAGIVGWHPGHALHKVFSYIHVFFDWLGEVLYPARMIKSVTFAHPIHTIKETEVSYEKLLTKLQEEQLEGEIRLQPEEEQPQGDDFHYSSPLERYRDLASSIDLDNKMSLSPTSG